MASRCAFGSLDDSITNIRKFERALSTRTPFCTTTEGRRGCARLRRFCTSTCARSALVPGSKLSVTEPVPSACETDSIYASPGDPFISRSITDSTLSSMVWADAPG